MSDIAERYFAAMRARDLDALEALFVGAPTMILPDGRELLGREAMRAMWSGLFAANPPSPTPVAVVVGDRAVAAEIEARLPDGTSRRTANFFYLDESGRIARLSIYRRG